MRAALGSAHGGAAQSSVRQWGIAQINVLQRLNPNRLGAISSFFMRPGKNLRDLGAGIIRQSLEQGIRGQNTRRQVWKDRAQGFRQEGGQWQSRIQTS